MCRFNIPESAATLVSPVIPPGWVQGQDGVLALSCCCSPQRRSLAGDGEGSRESPSAKAVSSIKVPRSLPFSVWWSGSIRQQLKKRHLVGWNAVGRG